jgi:hypothetical protein
LFFQEFLLSEPRSTTINGVRPPARRIQDRFVDGLAKSHRFRRLRKKPKVKARESRVARRTSSTPQRQRDEAQRRDWVFYEVVIVIPFIHPVFAGDQEA